MKQDENPFGKNNMSYAFDQAENDIANPDTLVN